MALFKIAGLSPASLLRSSITMKHHARTTIGSDIPELNTPIYYVSKERIFHEAVETASELKRWTIAEADLQKGFIRAEARTRTRFVDDVKITIAENASGGFNVEVESESRKGVSDMGQNTRNIAKFLQDLNRRLR